MVMGVSDNNRDYGIDYRMRMLVHNKFGKNIKEENNMNLIEDSNHIKNTFDVRFCMVGDDEELFRWTNARKIPRIGEQVTDCSVGGRKLYDIKWFTVKEIFHLNDHIVACAVSPYQPLKMKHTDVEKPLKRI